MVKASKTSIALEAQVGLNLSGFMGTVALFFTGILIAQLNNFDKSIKIPIILLVISTFAFLFSAVVYSNATGLLTSNKTLKATRYILVGNSLSEFLGLYLFVASVPMVIISISQDQFLRIAISFITIFCLFIYSLSQYSIFKRSFSRFTDIAFSFLILLTSSAMYFSQLDNNKVFPYLACALLLILILAALFSNELKVRDKK